MATFWEEAVNLGHQNQESRTDSIECAHGAVDRDRRGGSIEYRQTMF